MKKNPFNRGTTRREFLKTAAKVGAALPLLSALPTLAATKEALLIGDQHSQLEIEAVVDHWVGHQEACAALNVACEFMAHEYNPDLVITQTQNFATRKGKRGFQSYVAVDAIVPRVAKICQENKIYFSNQWVTQAWYTPLNAGDYYVQYNQPDGVYNGYETASYLFKTLGGKGTVVHIPGFCCGGTDEERTRGVHLALRDYPDIKLVTGQPGNFNRFDSRKSMEQVLVKVSNVDGAIGQSGDPCAGIVDVFKEWKIKAHVCGIDGTREELQLIKSGEMLATSAILNPWIGGFGVIALYDAMNGYKLSLPERMMMLPSILATKENADYCYKLGGFETGKMPFDWAKMSKTLYPETWDPQAIITPIDPWRKWEGVKVEQGMGLPKEYDEAKRKGEFERIQQLYADHCKNNLFKPKMG